MQGDFVNFWTGTIGQYTIMGFLKDQLNVMCDAVLFQ